MNIRRIFRLGCLSVASFFWASCGGDTDSSTGADSGINPGSSSADILPNSSESVESSSVAAESSSSQIGSSSSAGYILARDPSISCKMTHYGVRVCYNSCYDAIRDLEKDDLISEKQLAFIEDELESCHALENATGILYGTPEPSCKIPVYEKFECECSNDSIYVGCRLDSNQIDVDGVGVWAYGIDEYRADQSSSSSEEMTKNCPHEDFLPFTGILEEVQKELYEKIVQKLENDSTLSESGRRYLDSLLNHEKKTLRESPNGISGFSVSPYPSDNLFESSYYFKIDSKNWFSGYIAKTKTCEDGSPVITERYRQKYDDILQESLDLINKKLEEIELEE
jgi:hypothetical protein